MIDNLPPLGSLHARASLSELWNLPNLKLSREGPYYAGDTTLIFVTLDKSSSAEHIRYNDFFEVDLFHWDSQNQQSQITPRIQQILSGSQQVLLFCRVKAKIKGKTQLFVYAGRLINAVADLEPVKPVHIVFEAADFDELAPEPLKRIYDWRPALVGKAPTITSSAKPRISARRAAGQGWQADPILRRAVETYAMNCALKYYADL